MLELETIDGSNWQDFLSSPVPTFFMLGKTDCPACEKWTAELTDWLNGDAAGKYKGHVRFGKLLLGTPGLTEFKRTHTPWLKDVLALPFNSIWLNGQQVKSWDGNNVDRLTSRLDNVLLAHVTAGNWQALAKDPSSV